MDLDFFINGGWEVHSEVVNKDTGEIKTKNVFVKNIFDRCGVRNPTSVLNLNALQLLKSEIEAFIAKEKRSEQQLILDSNIAKEVYEKMKEPIKINKKVKKDGTITETVGATDEKG